MLRLIGGVIAGIVGWFVVVTAIDVAMRYGWHDYAAVEKAMTFTLPMMIARLSESAVSSLAGGYIAARIDKGGWAPLLAGTLLLLPFAYEHYQLLHRFPLWYHATFLLSLPVLSWVGGKFVRA
jgi:hypothetical protein